MKVSFSIKDPATLKSFLNVDSDFLEILITSEKVFFCAIRTGIYSQISFDVITRYNVDDLKYFRIDRKLFLSMLEECLVHISIVGDGKVLLEMEPKAKQSYTISLEHQYPNISTILDYQGILDKSNMFRKISLGPLKSKVSLLRAHDGVVTVNDGVIKMEINSNFENINTFIRAKVEDLAIQSIFLKYILDFSDDIYVYRNSIVGISDNISIVCAQAIPEITEDFNFVRRAKSLGKFVVDFTPIGRIVARSTNEVKYVNIDLKNKKAYFESGTTQLSTGFHSENLEKENPLTDDDLLSLLDEKPKTEEEDLQTKYTLPIKLFKDLIPKATYNLTVNITKRFLVLTNDKDIFFVVGRSSYD